MFMTPIQPKNTVAKFTVDMANSLLKYFPSYAENGVVSIEVNSKGLWLINPVNGSRQFLGKAVLDKKGSLIRISNRKIH